MKAAFNEHAVLRGARPEPADGTKAQAGATPAVPSPGTQPLCPKAALLALCGRAVNVHEAGGDVPSSVPLHSHVWHRAVLAPRLHLSSDPGFAHAQPGLSREAGSLGVICKLTEGTENCCCVGEGIDSHFPQD